MKKLAEKFIVRQLERNLLKRNSVDKKSKKLAENDAFEEFLVQDEEEIEKSLVRDNLVDEEVENYNFLILINSKMLGNDINFLVEENKELLMDFDEDLNVC